MNSIILIGRLTADPELKFFSTGVAISRITIAIDRSYRKDNQSVTDFIPVEIWGKKGEYCATYIEKGCLVAIAGSLHIDRYVDSSGNNRTFAKVVASSITKLNSPNKSTNIDGIIGTDITNIGDSKTTHSGNTDKTANPTTPSSDPTANLTELVGDDQIPF